MRLYEFRDGKLHPYWLRNGLTIGVGMSFPTSETFRIYNVRRIGRGYLWPIRSNGKSTLALFPECNQDFGALIIVGGSKIETDGRIILQNSTAVLIELQPKNSIRIGRFGYIWDGHNLKRI